MVNLIGQTVNVGNSLDTMRLLDKQKKDAKEYEWLFQCTNSDSLLSILKNRELWLSNLKLVNDKNEVDRIDIPEYETSLYVGCFTFQNNIPKEHWEEYGNIENGVLFGFKRKWVTRKVYFMTGTTKDDEYIYKNHDEALNSKIDNQNHRKITNPFYIFDFDFYKMIYDDNLFLKMKDNAKIDIDGTSLNGKVLVEYAGGVVKLTGGMCVRHERKPYWKDWTTEKEVRLKVGIRQYDNEINGNEIHDGMIMRGVFWPRIAVELKDDAFDELVIRLSPEFTEPDDFISKLETIIPKERITILK